LIASGLFIKEYKAKNIHPKIINAKTTHHITKFLVETLLHLLTFLLILFLEVFVFFVL
jgi:hypothetical protein